MKASAYVQALTRAIASGTSEATAADNLITHLKASGRMKLMPRILQELKALDARHTAREAHVEVAHAHDAEEALRQASEAGVKARTTRVNHSLISGWRAHTAGTLVDRSGKRALLDIYRRVTRA